MSRERKIKPVENPIEKRTTYEKYKAQLTKAIKYEFYLEAMMIEYAILEDRMRSFLYHIGALPDRKSTSVERGTKADLKGIVTQYRIGKEKDNLGITNLSGKEKIIKCVLRWSLDNNKETGTKYLTVLNDQINIRINANEMLKTLEEVDNWCTFRNEIVHALMNKNISSINDQIADQVEKGKELTNRVSNYENRIKYYKKIRKAANLPIE